MRNVIFPVANSADNFIAAPDGGVEWIRFSDEIEAILAEMWTRVGAVVMGRKTYDFMKANGVDAYEGVENYVFSNTLDPAEHDKISIVSGDVADTVRALKEEGGGDIWMMGGAEIARQCFNAGLVDELHLNIHPLLLGSGAPLFLELEKPIELELLACRPLPQECVALRYRVKH